MPLRTFALLAALTTAVCAPSAAQTVVRGTVTDAATGAPLAAATVQVEGTFDGTITNAEGDFALRTDRTPARLVVRYIGYATGRADVPAGDSARVDVRLEPSAVEMETVTVTGDDPARNIMRRVIEAKRTWWDDLDTYAADAYTRFTLENDTGIVSIIESLSRVYGDAERGTREVVLSRRQTANLPFDDALPAALFVTNLYDDDIEIAGYTFVGVTHPDALRHYDFRLIGTRYLDDTLVYDIAVAPKNRLKTAFEGRVAVLAGVYALLEVELRPSEAFLFPPPINRFDVTYTQQFSNYGERFWLPVDFRSSTDLRIAFGPLLSFPDIHVDQVSRLTNYTVGVPVPDSLFTGDDYLAVDSAAVAADTLLDRAGVAVPLAARERLAYAGIDSTMTLERAYAPRGALARFVDSESDGDGGSVSVGAGDGGGLGVSFSPNLRYDRVEGAFVGGAASVPLGPAQVEGRVGYATGRDERAWAYGVGASVRVRRLRAWADYDEGIAPRYAAPAYPRVFTSGVALLGGDDYFDYLWRTRAAAGAAYRLAGPGVTLRAAVERGRQEGVGKTTDYDLLGRATPFRLNPEVVPGDYRAATLGVVWGPSDRDPVGVTGGRRLALQVEAGDLVGPSPSAPVDEARYARFSLEGDLRVETFFRRRFLPNALDLRLTASRAVGDVPLARVGTVDGALGPYAPFGTLRTRPGRPYEGTHHVALFWEHHFRTVPFELVGLRGLARDGYGVILHGAHARTWGAAHDAGAYALDLARGHHEVGVGLSGLLGLFRVDVTTRLDAPGVSVSAAAARLF